MKYRNKKILIDCTLGLGGHSSLFMDDEILLIGIDKDTNALNIAKNKLRNAKDLIILHAGFGEIIGVVLEITSSNLNFNEKIQKLGALEKLVFFKINGEIKIDKLSDETLDFTHISVLKEETKKAIEKGLENSDVALLADLGISSMQIDDKSRGFSFKSENLDMRMNMDSNITASDILSNSSEHALAEIFKNYGEIRNHKKLAREIKNHKGNIDAKTLNEICHKFIPKGSINQSTLIYQALRIAVNGELDELETLLTTINNQKNLSVIIISFHSLEDRLVKSEFKNYTKACKCDNSALYCTCDRRPQAIYLEKLLVPQASEIAQNPRSRSAKLRAISFI